jgi:septum formation protein
MHTAELILASASLGRANMLREAGLEFRQVPAVVDERVLEEQFLAEDKSGINGGKLAQILAKTKASEVSKRFPQAVVTGVDQVMECDGQLFHKPSTQEEARQQLASLRGRTHQLHTGLSVFMEGLEKWRYLAVAYMTMRSFSDAFLDAYCAAEGETMLQTVGAYRIEGRGVQLFSSIEGDHFTIVGLPLIPLLEYLRNIGWLTA